MPKKYQIIYADPPWRFKNWSMAELAKRGEKWARKNGRSPYDVMDNDTIQSVLENQRAEQLLPLVITACKQWSQHM